MGKASRDKGYRTENNLRKQALLHDDIECYRVPLSGATDVMKGDLILNKTGGEKWHIEVKCRASGFKEIYKWIDGHDALIIKTDNNKALMVMDYDDALELIAGRSL